MSGSETVLYSFKAGRDGSTPEASLIEFRGRLYGTTFGGGANGHGTAFRVDPASGTERLVHSFQVLDGTNPTSGVINFGGILFGTTSAGGHAGQGTVFSYTP